MMKRCNKCGEEKPATTEFYSRNASKKDGLEGCCKPCANERNRAYYEANAEVISEQNRAYYVVNAEAIGEKRRAYYEANAEALGEQHRAYNAANAEEISEQKRAYYVANAEAIGEQKRAYRAANAEAINEKARAYYVVNAEAIGERNRAYQVANPEICKASAQRREARKRALPATLTAQEWQYAIDYFHGCCAVCGRPLKDLFATHTAAMDHWLPLSKGGGTTAGNILPLCHGKDGCNNRKNDALPEAWLVRQFGKHKAKKILARINAYFLSIEE